MNMEEAKTLIAEMSQGNPGAMTALVELLKDGWMMEPYVRNDAMDKIKLLKEKNILGVDIYLLYNDLCDRNIYKTTGLVKALQLGLLKETELKEDLARVNSGGKSTLDIKQIIRNVKGGVPGFDPVSLCADCYAEGNKTVTVKEWIKKTIPKEHKLRDFAVCGDDTVLSIQASSQHYCYPKVDNAEHYETVEVQVISGKPPKELSLYYKGGVYGKVPMPILEEVVAGLGGIVYES